jgi:hypothetical protein
VIATTEALDAIQVREACEALLLAVEARRVNAQCDLTAHFDELANVTGREVTHCDRRALELMIGWHIAATWRDDHLHEMALILRAADWLRGCDYEPIFGLD